LEFIIITAVSQNNIIGKEGGIPWHSKEELKHFKKTTFGFPVIMGRKTWDIFGKPLPGRLNIVISRNPVFTISFREVIVFNSLKQAFSYFRTSVYDKVFIIGGSAIFQEAVDLVDKMIISEMNFECEGDVNFPEINYEDWQLEMIEDFSDFQVKYYKRKNIESK
jgi:dihydrofolate reductase